MRALCLALLVLLAGCQASAGAEVGYEIGDGSVTVMAPQDREPAPELAGETLEGQSISTSDYQGQYVVLNVWGSWCAPCRAEAPALVAAQERLDDVVFLGVNTRDLDPAPALAFQRAFELNYPSLYDPDGSLLLGFSQLPPKAIPSTLIIDEQGRVAARVLGVVSESTLVALMDDVRDGS